MNKKVAVVFVAALAGALAGCNGGGSASAGAASMTLGVTDTPVDGVQKVNVAFTGVDLMGPNGLVQHTFSKEKTVDLLTLQGNASETLLSGVNIPAGNYQWIRFDIDTSNSDVIGKNGGQYNLTILSSSQTGLKLVSGFTAAQGGQLDFVVDFDLRQAMTSTTTANGTTYMLKPALRLINKQKVGTVSGTTAGTVAIGSNTVAGANCDPAVYVYSGASVTPGGYLATVTNGTTPLTSATVKLDSSTGSYGYTVGFLAPGTYTLALTCSADDTSGSTSLSFTGTQNVDVTANATATANF